MHGLLKLCFGLICESVLLDAIYGLGLKVGARAQARALVSRLLYLELSQLFWIQIGLVKRTKLGRRRQALGSSFTRLPQLHIGCVLELFLLNHVPLDALSQSVVETATEIIVLKVSSGLWTLVLLLLIAIVDALVLGKIDCLRRPIADYWVNN